MPFKALATKQPWASLIAAGQKTIEVRSWKTNYRGPLVIIASSTPNRDFDGHFPTLKQPTSCLMAVVDLVDVRPGRSSDSKAAFCDPTGNFSWVLANARKLKPRHYTKSRVMTFDLEDRVKVELLEPDARGLSSEWTPAEQLEFGQAPSHGRATKPVVAPRVMERLAPSVRGEEVSASAAAWLSRLGEIASQVAGGEHPEHSVRTLLSWFGVGKRGVHVVAEVRRQLRKHKLKTLPDFNDAGMDEAIRFVPIANP